MAGFLCHHIAHVLNRHPVSHKEKEQLEADEFSGFAMRLIGATLEQAQGSYFGGQVKENFEVIERGWRRLD